MRKNNYKSQNGSISMFVMVALAFFLTTIVGIYVISGKRAQTQTESLGMVKGKYYTENEENQRHTAKIADDSAIIPIYTKEQLWSIEENKTVEIEGKIYNFTQTQYTRYELKNDIIINIKTDLANSKFKDNYIYGNNTINKNNFGVYYYYEGNYYVPVQYSDGTTTNNLCSGTPVLSASGTDFKTINTNTTGLSGKYYLFANANLSGDLGYVTDGLILHYDGIKNTATGHKSDATTWKDLSGNGNDGVLSGFNNTELSGWKKDSLDFDKIDDKLNVNLKEEMQIDSSITTEILFRDLDLEGHQNSAKGYCILEADSDWRGFLFHDWIQDSLGVNGFYIGGGCYGDNYEMNRFSPDELDGYKKRYGIDYYVTYTYNSTDKIANCYINGTKYNTEQHTMEPDSIKSFLMKYCGKKFYAVRIYNSALTDSEVQQNYEIDKARFGIE